MTHHERPHRRTLVLDEKASVSALSLFLGLVLLAATSAGLASDLRGIRLGATV